jgi:hypothetical protein
MLVRHSFSERIVIPGLGVAESPEPMHTGLR